MITFYSAHYVMPVTAPPIINGVVAVDREGYIHGVYQQDDPEIADKPIVQLKGLLAPGFINAHCHLELSHMKGQIAEGIGLIDFLSTVMTQRGADKDEVMQAMVRADHIMYEKGIQAVGDHVNSEISATVKQSSKIRYRTFVEMMGMDDQVDVEAKVEEAKRKSSAFCGHRASPTFHAPYSCSQELFTSLRQDKGERYTLSIHNQESAEENKLFLTGAGAFLRFYDRHGIRTVRFAPTGRTSVQSYAAWLPETARLLLVHNTHTSTSDLAYLDERGREVFFCLCPRSNRYIEGAFPPVLSFVDAGAKIVLGTDSLASNHSLDILEELKAIHEACPELELSDTLRWATIYGAEALELDGEMGSIEVGKRSGLVLLDHVEDMRLTKDSTATRIA